MIKFKKYLVASMATLMCLSPVFAVDTPEDDHSTKLNYIVDQSYKWSAPADITFTTNVDRESITGTVSVTENIIAGNETLKISIDSNAKFQIESKEHSVRKYKVFKNSDELLAGSLVLEVPSGRNGATQNLDFELQGVKSGNTSQVAGTYTGTLNFVANIETAGSENPGGSGSESGGSGGNGGTGGDSGSGGSSTPTIDLTNVNVAGVVGDFSTVGNLVTINDTEYRVLSINGTQAKVMSMKPYKSSYYNSSNIFTDFNGTEGQQYDGSLLDTELNTNYYASLPEVIRDAIVPQTINQSMYRNQKSSSSITEGAVIQRYNDFDGDGYWDNDTTKDAKRGLLKIAEITVGERNVYALDVDDVIEYFGGGWNCQQLNTLFFKTTSSVSSKYVWLRSAGFGFNSNALLVYGNSGSVGDCSFNYSGEVRPVFVIDLSLLS